MCAKDRNKYHENVTKSSLSCELYGFTQFSMSNVIWMTNLNSIYPFVAILITEKRFGYHNFNDQGRVR